MAQREELLSTKQKASRLEEQVELVRTPMTAPTKLYRKLPMMGADEAADWMLRAVRDRPARVSDPRGFAFQMAMAAAPGPTARFTGWFFDRMVRKLSS